MSEEQAMELAAARDENDRLRARVSGLEAERDRLVDEHMDCPMPARVAALGAEADKWERAARRLATAAEALQPEKNEDGWIMWALGDEP